MKFRELSKALSLFFDCERKELNEPEIQGNPDEIIRHKMLRAYEVFRAFVLVDDVSAHFDELKGFPGPYIKYLWDHFTPEEAGEKFEGTRMTAVCRLGLCRTPEDIIIVRGEASGTIIKPSHNNHRGQDFDLFLVVDGTDKPMIEFSPDEKNKFSHRGKALNELLKILKNENS